MTNFLQRTKNPSIMIVAPARLKRLALAVFLAAVLLPRLIIPTGYMPRASASGFTITMCGGMAPVIVAISGDTKKSTPTHDPCIKPCLFSAAVSQAALDVFPSAIAALSWLSHDFEIPRTLAHLTANRLAAPPPPSQAPPVTA